MVKLHPTMSHHYIPQPSMPLHLVGVESQHPRPPVKMHGEEVACKAPHSWDVCVYICIYTNIYQYGYACAKKDVYIYIYIIL